MLFSSLVFISIFLPVIVFLNYFAKKGFRNYILLIASLLFYAWGTPSDLIIMLFIILFNYVMGLAVEKYTVKKMLIGLAVFGNLSVLFFFKYYNFLAVNINKVNFFDFPTLSVVMPIGISFFTFQAMSYVIDVYRGGIKAQKNIYDLALYISFFPQLIAGPIVKYHDIQLQLQNRISNLEKIYYGFKRFSFGLAKKVLISNVMGEVADKIFANSIDGLDYKIAWVGAICYTLQLYFDFSGYSDMAIGLGKMFGFDFLENFNYPYISKSITEFWRRWHISLGSWFREYLYIPLGGNRKGASRTYINLFIVFLATGIWHGANWTFIFWGLWHGIFIVIERKIKIENFTKKWQIIMRHIYTCFIFIIGWVIFRAETLTYALDYIKIMFGFIINENQAYGFWYYVDSKVLLFGAIAVLASTGIFKNFFVAGTSKLKMTAVNIFSLLVLIYSMISIASSTYNPFIYFRF